MASRMHTLLILAGVLSIPVTTGIGRAQSCGLQGLTGSWAVTVTSQPGAPGGPPPPPPFRALHTFTAGGGLVETAAIDPLQGDPPFRFSLSPGHGAWSRTGGQTASARFVKLLFDPRGVLVGMLQVQTAITLDEKGNSWSGPFTAQVFDPEGNLLNFYEGTNQGTRVTAEPRR